ncbi:MAG: RdgB/HAM1 family non-canonical purine NTP pyrophosphatase [Sandaracinaceae bacterium]
MKLVVATRNPGKIRELARLLDGLGLELVMLPDDAPDVIEDADSFEGNATKKALEGAAFTGEPCVADDSGLVVDALGGAPGIHSARYAGTHGDDEANNARLLRELEAVPDDARTARFVCVLAFADPRGPLGASAHLTRGTIEGTILRAPRGDGGFGYDPLFLPLGGSLTTAEMPAAAKNEISHRAEAARALRAFLAPYLEERA